MGVHGGVCVCVCVRERERERSLTTKHSTPTQYSLIKHTFSALVVKFIHFLVDRRPSKKEPRSSACLVYASVSVCEKERERERERERSLDY